MRLYLLWMFLVFVAFFTLNRDRGLYEGHKQMCQKIKSNFVETLTEEEYQSCVNIYDSVISYKDWEAKTNAWLGLWGWSHLAVYSPSQSEEIWESKTENIGVKLKQIEGQFLVYRAREESSFLRGDVILKVNGKTDFDETAILQSGGGYEVLRDSKIFKIEDAKTSEFIWNDEVTVDAGVMRVPSFRGEFFNDENMEKLIEKLSKQESSKIVLDLRDNMGGNIAAGLRLMSLFVCDAKSIGAFEIPSKKDLGSSDYPLEIEQEVQVDHLKKFGRVSLKIPKNDFCTDKEVIVLVNESTSSTAEMVAQAFIDLKRGEAVGEQTSGRMVLSSWDQVPNFPDGFYFSYPYALYSSLSGSRIEKEGVIPDRYKTYSLEIEKQGLDSFLN